VKRKNILPSEITIFERQRKELGDLSTLTSSIQKQGLIQPIAVHELAGGGYSLVAGERRLTAWTLILQEKPIPCNVYKGLTDAELNLVEYAENHYRKALTWQENVKVTAQVHIKGLEADKAWTTKQSTESLGITQQHLNRCIRVYQALIKGNEAVKGSPTLASAFNICQRTASRAGQSALSEAIGEIYMSEEVENLGDDALFVNVFEANDDLEFDLEELEDEQGGRRTTTGATSSSEHPSSATDERTICSLTSTPTELDPFGQVAKFGPGGYRLGDNDIVRGDFLTLAAGYSGGKCNLVSIDPPYGIDHQNSSLGSAESHGAFEDSDATYWQILESLFTNIDRLLEPDAHVLLFLSMNNWGKTRAKIFNWAREAGWLVQVQGKDKHPCQDVPLIWVKSDNAGILADHRRRPRNICEYAMIVNIGDRQIAHPISNAFSWPADKKNASHLSEKPQEVMDTFMKMFVDESTKMADFTCGSGTSVLAAAKLGAKSVFGMDLDQEHVAHGAEQLSNWRREQV